jgi:2,4-dienoyl-CoA reductase-like NADH-dependent reductase (Old Yellow Enzyme family)
MRDAGLDLLNVSIGFSTMAAKTPWRPAFLVPVVGRVRREAALPVASAWCIDGAHDAERAVAEKQMDIVMIGRAHLADPHYAYHLAQVLKEDRPAWSTLPAPYAYWLSRYRGPGMGSAE